MKTFIRVVEMWVPNAQRGLLEFGGGLYRNAPRFGSISRSMCFGRGEGLPGRAWESGRPIVLKQFAESTFRRTHAAAIDGLTCGIALPVFAGERLTAVLLLFCGDDAAHAGAIELWHNDPGKSADMKLDDGYYGNTAEVFEFISRQTSFRRGNGLPGLAWASGLPVFMPDLGKGGRFVRSDSAVKVGINRGLALPCSGRGKDTWVMAFLSALGTPIASRFETWLAHDEGEHLQRQEGFCEKLGLIGAGGPDERVERGEGALGLALAACVPMIAERAALEPGAPGAAARAAGCESLVALPISRGGRVAAVVAWYF